MNKILCLVLLFTLFLACNKEAIEETTPTETTTTPQNEKFFFKDGDRWLWGGHNEDWHFKINNLDLNPNNFKYGLGRESFGVLNEPQYMSITDASEYYGNGDEFIIIQANEGVKAYPIDLMIKHETLNEVFDGHPVMVGYCVLADFVAIYSRNYCGNTLTFAVSGYTYYEDGIWFSRDGFILWDRDTESLWWPLINKSVSGGMKGVSYEAPPSNISWERQDWSYLVNNYPDAEVLATGQDGSIPEYWPEIPTEDLNCE